MAARNRAMVDQSDLLVCCVEKAAGGAARALEYAAAQGVAYVNLAEAN